MATDLFKWVHCRGLVGEWQGNFVAVVSAFFQACTPPKVRAMTLLLLSDCACCSNKARTLFPDTVYTSILRGLSGAVGVTAKGNSSARFPVFPPLPVLPPFPVLPFSPLHQASRPPGPSPSLQQPRFERDGSSLNGCENGLLLLFCFIPVANAVS